MNIENNLCISVEFAIYSFSEGVSRPRHPRCRRGEEANCFRRGSSFNVLFFTLKIIELFIQHTHNYLSASLILASHTQVRKQIVGAVWKISWANFGFFSTSLCYIRKDRIHNAIVSSKRSRPYYLCGLHYWCAKKVFAWMLYYRTVAKLKFLSEMVMDIVLPEGDTNRVNLWVND